MKKRAVGFLALIMLGMSAHSQDSKSASDLLHAGLAAMGGEDKVRGLRTLHFQAVAQRNELEQSERPEGPYIVEYDQVEEWRDLAHNNWKKTESIRVAMQPEYSSTIVVSEGAASRSFNGKALPASGQQLQEADEVLALSPERVMVTGLASSDLHRLPDLTLQNVPHQEVEFTWQEHPVRIFLNAETRLPTAVEWAGAYPFAGFWSIWGDVTTRIYYSFWWLQNGIHYPLQADVVRNGLPDRTVTISKIDYNQPLAPADFTISPELRTSFAGRAKMTVDDRPLAIPGQAASELAPGIVFLPGAWNTTLVRQDDGVVVLEAPISSGYSAKVIKEAQKRFPGLNIKAVITTSDSWPHIGGLREYVAHGIPVYVLDRTVPLIERFLRAPRTRYPDALAKAPRPADLHPVSTKVVVGAGPNRMELYPIHGETSERQMMVYFPEHKLLYGSDPFQKLEDGTFFYPQTVYELQSAVEREHLTVERLFMMHVELTPWAEALKALREAL